MRRIRIAPNGIRSVLVFAIALALAGAVGWRLLLRGFVRRYYTQAYEPVRLAATDVGDYPSEQHLRDVPWIAADVPVCQSTSLQMIAAQRGAICSRAHIDFLMAFTYGFSAIPGMDTFFPGGIDPEVGLRDAAPYLGLRRRYYVTDDPALYLRALRSFLARGYPVRVALDMGALYGASTFIPHSDVLIGYDASGFYLYETVCVPPATCAPGERPPGAAGIYVTEARLLQAVTSLARRIAYPWRYSLTIFEPGPRADDLRPVWERLANATLGGNRYGPPTGVAVLERVADQIERRGSRYPLAKITESLESAARFRRDNARYLREHFPDEADLARAAEQFEQAADRYAAALGGRGADRHAAVEVDHVL
ncbi:MAG: BtrH N-terminal domain-containing protein, partial [Chloroflexaceae bacterium]|nr:BtrH N-terminal domain-containing protein [Chloroflexaceae bacterium]